MVAASPDAIISSSLDGRILSWNPGAETIFGYKAREVVGKNISILAPRESKRQQKQIIARIRHGERVTQLETVRLRKDGRKVDVSLTIAPIKDENRDIIGAAAIVQDVTERKRSDQSWRDSEERFRLLVEGAREYAMFLVGPDNRIVFWSKGAERLFGWTQSEALGKKGDLIFTPEDRARGAVQQELGIARREGRAADRRWHARKDGSRFWTDGLMMRLDEERTGALRGFAKIARDATDEWETERALRRAHDELQRRVKARTAQLIAVNEKLKQELNQREKLEAEILQVSEREQRRLGQDLHDSLCQHLAATAFMTRAIAERVKSAKTIDAAEIEKIADLINAGVTEARTIARGLYPVDLNSADLMTALQSLVSQKNWTVRCRLEGNDEVVRTDPTVALHLYRIAREAIINANKHARAREIIVRMAVSKNELELSVTDDGIGISDGSLASEGLGLHIMRDRARSMGGRLEVTRLRPRGTRVACHLPRT